MVNPARCGNNMKKFKMFFLCAFTLSLFGMYTPLIASEAQDIIVINEIMINPSAVSDTKGEWFEIYNSSTLPVSLDGWTINDGNNDSFTINGAIVPANDYFVFGRNGDNSLNGGVGIDYVYSGMYLSNNGDALFIYNNEGILIDAVEYSGIHSFEIPNGCSIELINPTKDNSRGCHWHESTVLYGNGDCGTPGAQNSCYQNISETPAAVPFHAIMKVFSFQAATMLGQLEQSIQDVALYSFPNNTNANVIDSYATHMALALDAYQRALYRVQSGDFLRAKHFIALSQEQVAICKHLTNNSKNDMGTQKSKVVFCDNMLQYYDHIKAVQLLDLLEEMSFSVTVCSNGEITKDVVSDACLVIIPNPQRAFSETEVATLECFMQNGGKLLLSGQYYKYLFPDFINPISEQHGIRFTNSEVVDYEHNTGKHYYPLITVFEPCVFPETITEIHFAYGCALEVSDGMAFLRASPTAQTLSEYGEILHEEGSCPILVALSGDNALMCISSSTILTTSLNRGDNKEAVRALISLFVEGGHKAASAQIKMAQATKLKMRLGR